MVAAAIATAASAGLPPLNGPRAPSRLRSRGVSVRCAAVAGGAAEAPASTGARVSADCVVVGGGISGLCTAQALATKHCVGDVLVTEARARPGGNITTVERPDEGYLWEEGPNSFQPSDPVLTMAVRSSLWPPNSSSSRTNVEM
jgi:oxygen-dependent protoporphyrinogen oxidase